MRAVGITDKIDVEDTQEFNNMNAVMVNAEEGSGLGEGTEVTHSTTLLSSKPNFIKHFQFTLLL